MKKRILLYQAKHLIDKRVREANKAADFLTETVRQISAVILELPTMEELQDYFDGGKKIFEKAEEAAYNDSRTFGSFAAKQMIKGSIQGVKDQLTTIQIELFKNLSSQNLYPALFEMDHTGRMTPLQSWIDEVVENNSVKATPGSIRFKAFALSKTVMEALLELKDILRENKIEHLAAVSTPVNFSAEGLVYCDDELTPHIQVEMFDSIPDTEEDIS